jgi:hypothetical protein
MVDLAGPFIDTNPPFAVPGGSGETTTTWKFKNKTGGRICDLSIHIDGPWWHYLPKIRDVTVKGADGSTLGTQSFDKVKDANIKISPCVEDDASFTVTVHLNTHFDPGESIQFTPSDTDGHNVVAVATPIDPEYVAMIGKAFPQPISDIATIGGLLPIPWWTPITASVWIRRLLRLLAEMPVEVEVGGGAAAGKPAEEDDVEEVAWQLVRQRLGREPSKSQVQDVVTNLRMRRRASAGGSPPLG